MDLCLLAQAVAGGMTIIQWLIVAIVVAGAIGIAIVVAKAAGLAIPAWLIQILWIVLAVLVGVFAIRLIATMLMT